MVLIQTAVDQIYCLGLQNNLNQGTILLVMRESIMKEPPTGRTVLNILLVKLNINKQSYDFIADIFCTS